MGLSGLVGGGLGYLGVGGRKSNKTIIGTWNVTVLILVTQRYSQTKKSPDGGQVIGEDSVQSAKRDSHTIFVVAGIIDLLFNQSP